MSELPALNHLTPLLIAARDPAFRYKGNDAEAALLVRQARAADLLAHLQQVLDGRIASNVSPRLQEHLQAARILADKQHQIVRWEVEQISKATRRVGAPMVLLKGAAYVAAGIRAGQGRLLSDIDILVPAGAIEDVERSMKRSGYFPKEISDYDRRYYREWSHEIPPVVHLSRQTTVDIHHSILPPTTRLKPDSRLLLAEAEPLPGYEEVYTLSPRDMILHSACHLFHEGELHHGLRDLVDIHTLLDEFMTDQATWEGLVNRARQLDLMPPLYYALRYASRILNTPVPPEIFTAIAPGGPGPLVGAMQDWCFGEAFKPHHPSCDRWHS
ncbi:MAG: hypothetical protein D6720_08530, partial [Gammaproteobacteria bacterium]